MKIRLGESDHVGDLLRFLRDSGCIAYTTGGTEVIEAIHPDTLGEKEQTVIRTLLDSWLADRPSASVQIDAS